MHAGRKTASSKVIGKLDVHKLKDEIRPLSLILHRRSQLQMDQRHQCETYNSEISRKKKYWEYCTGYRDRKQLSEKDSTQELMLTIDKQDLIKLKTYVQQSKHSKRKTTERERILANYF